MQTDIRVLKEEMLAQREALHLQSENLISHEDIAKKNMTFNLILRDYLKDSDGEGRFMNFVKNNYADEYLEFFGEINSSDSKDCVGEKKDSGQI
jgi:hypothetical protein